MRERGKKVRAVEIRLGRSRLIKGLIYSLLPPPLLLPLPLTSFRPTPFSVLPVLTANFYSPHVSPGVQRRKFSGHSFTFIYKRSLGFCSCPLFRILKTFRMNEIVRFFFSFPFGRSSLITIDRNHSVSIFTCADYLLLKFEFCAVLLFFLGGGDLQFF